MNHDDQSRFVANVQWFNRFFADIRQLYELVVDLMPNDFFNESFVPSSRNYYFSKQNFAPTIPPYYVLMVGGKRLALQVLTVFDPSYFGNPSLFANEPSIVVVLHSQADRYGYIEEYAERVIGNKEIRIEKQDEGRLWGRIHAKVPADFFSFQVTLDRFSAERDPHDAVREHIVRPIQEELENRR
jgi:hypothetical protein